MADAGDTMVNRGWTQPLESSESVRRDPDIDAELTWALTASIYTQSVLLETARDRPTPGMGMGMVIELEHRANNHTGESRNM